MKLRDFRFTWLIGLVCLLLSTMAAQAFRAAGFRAFNVDGGIEQWVAEGRPISPEDGHVAQH